MITLSINGKEVSVPESATVAAAILNSGETEFRTSPTGETRAPLCGMGTCFECRVTIDGSKHQRSCMRTVENGMEVITGE